MYMTNQFAFYQTCIQRASWKVVVVTGSMIVTSDS